MPVICLNLAAAQPSQDLEHAIAVQVEREDGANRRGKGHTPQYLALCREVRQLRLISACPDNDLRDGILVQLGDVQDGAALAEPLLPAQFPFWIQGQQVTVLQAEEQSGLAAFAEGLQFYHRVARFVAPHLCTVWVTGLHLAVQGSCHG